MSIAIAALFAVFCLCGPCLGSPAASLLPHFNCKKIAFYKTHKTGSTTLGGVLFRLAVAANRSLYTTASSRSHYISLGFRENGPLLGGGSDVVLRHIRFTEGPAFLAATRSFYGRALGTADFGFLTSVRNPVDRYVSDFFYYSEPDARRSGGELRLRQFVAAGRGANRMAAEFAVRTAAEAAEFVAGEMAADGLFLPLELLDYGLALLAARCDWRLSGLLYLPANSNSGDAQRFGNVTLTGRPTMAQLAEQDPPLLNRIADLNALDAALYGAAVSRLLTLLQPYGAAAAAMSDVTATAVRLTAARKRLEAQCAALRGGGAAAAAAAPAPAGNEHTSRAISADDLAGLCTWYSMPDSVYERLSSPETGRVAADAVLAMAAPPLAAAGSWPVGHLLRLANTHFTSYGDDSSVPYYHTLVAVRARPPTMAEAELVYGMAGSGGGALAGAVRLWTSHHAREGIHHLFFIVDSDSGDAQQQEETVRLAAAGALRGAGDGSADDDASGGGAVASYTTFSILRCANSSLAAVTSGGGGGCDASTSGALHDLTARSRWSAVLPSLSHFLYGTRGSVRSVLMSYEVTLQAAGAVCAPLVAWRTPPPGVRLGWSGGGGGGGRGARGTAGGAATAAAAFQGADVPDGTERGIEGGSAAPHVLRRRRRHSRRRRYLEELESPGSEASRLQRGVTAVDIAAGGTKGGGAAAAAAAGVRSPSCMRAPCSLTVKDPLRCVMVRGMPLLGRTRSYTSAGAVLPDNRSSYRVSYRGPEQHRLEVARLSPPSEEDRAAAAAAAAGGEGTQEQQQGEGEEVFRCSRVPRPRLRVPWCK